MITFRVSTPEDFDLLVALRLKFMLEFHPEASDDDRTTANDTYTKYLKNLIAQDRFIGYLGYLDSTPVCVAGLLLYELPPLMHRLQRKVGHVLNFYTEPEYRRKGYGKALMQFIIDDAKNRDINVLVLNATKVGEPLYRYFGFKESDAVALQLYL